MGYVPLFLNVEGARCLVVGGGQTASRKALMLLEAGAQVVAVSPRFSEAFSELQQRFRAALTLHAGTYTPQDLAGYRLVFAATDDPPTNQAVAADAKRANLWVNVVDEPELCTAICGAVLQRGPVQVAVSTGGVCPALAATLRDELAAQCPDSLDAYATVLGGLRNWLREHCPDPGMRTQILHQLASREVRDRYENLEPDALSSALKTESETLLHILTGTLPPC